MTVEAARPTRRWSSIRDEFMITRSGKQFVLFAGLLDEFHAKAREPEFEGAHPTISTDLHQVPVLDGNTSGEDVAIVTAEAGYKNEAGAWVYGPFSGIGDASPDNVGKNIVPHIIRMAETRAKARALRDAVNVGATSLEELGDEDGEASSNPPTTRKTKGRSQGRGQGQSRRGSGSSRSSGQTSRAQSSTAETTQSGSPQTDEPNKLKGGATKARKFKMGKPMRDILAKLVKEWREGVETNRDVLVVLDAIGKAQDKPVDEWSDAEAEAVAEWIQGKIDAAAAEQAKAEAEKAEAEAESEKYTAADDGDRPPGNAGSAEDEEPEQDEIDFGSEEDFEEIASITGGAQEKA